MLNVSSLAFMISSANSSELRILVKTEDYKTFFTILVTNQHDAQENGNNL